MKKILGAVAVLAFVAGLSVIARASSCTGYKVTTECIPAENILDGTLGASVQGSGCGASNLPQGVTVTYGLTAGSGTITGTSASALIVAGGVTAGTPANPIINVSGKIPALSSTYFASLDASNLTGIVTAGLTDSLVTSNKIASLAITNGKYAANSITSDKLSTSGSATGKILCAKSDGGIGICADIVDTGKTCTCN